MRPHLLYTLVIIACARFCLSQNVAKKPDTVFCDCSKARVVKISGGQKVGETIAPSGFGELQEISPSKLKTPYAFEKEHNSAWYKLILNAKGNLAFTITPAKPEDDYDFMLFQAGKNNFCDSLEKFKIKPLRANISRDKNELQGKTGMTIGAKRELVKKGINDAYSHSIPVEKGEIYYLVLDNVYENGGGHTINFFFEQMVDVRGTVRDDENKPLSAVVSITDIKGTTLVETKSNAKTGEYEIKMPFKRGTTYSLNYYSDSTFIYSKTISLKDSVALQSLKMVLPKLRKGKKYSIGAINFQGGSPEYLPVSVPTMENLFKLMEKNKNLKIQIEGHTNGCGGGVQELSEMRAEAVKKYLVKKGIRDGRIETSGKGCSEMLFELPCSEEKQEQNRRVEIKVLDY